jgi:hypothetical protein
MATDDGNTSPLGQAEMSALAARLRARADSVLFRDQPEQARDLRQAADLIEILRALRVGGAQ